jgi:long-chain acyl-CoA synthetase
MKIKIRDYNETGILKNILLDNILFRRVKASFGGRLRFMLVGSAPVEPEILNFLRCSLSCEIVEGYGQTEDIAGVLLTRTIDPVTQHLGGPGFSCEIKLRDVNELGYTSKTKDEKGRSRPSGELMVRGPIIFKGYFRDKEKTKETIEEDGWMHSGDIATIIPEHGNAVKIVDRVKNIFKLQQGEYISPEKIENILSGNKYVDQIFIYGDTLQNYLIAFIYPSQREVINLLKNKYNDINEQNYKEHFEEEEIKKEIIKDIDTYGRKNDLKGFELPKKIYLCKEPFSIENQIITPTMKIRRHQAKKFFAKEINKLYGFK